jgi:hypothetical protein
LHKINSIEGTLSRWNFVRIAALGGVTLGLAPLRLQSSVAQGSQGIPATNGKDALASPRTSRSLSGAFPGRVVQLLNDKVVVGDGFDVKALHTIRGTCRVWL